MDDLAISLRPQTFEEMIGVDRLVKRIRGYFDGKHGKIPKAWMFSGQPGAGKTTIARIMAVSLQCRHQDVFGSPCRKCYKHQGAFDIVTLNVKQRRVEDMEGAISAAYNFPKPGSRRRVYILDEAHMLTDHTQNLLLEPLENCPRTTNWIICTTRPDKLLDTVQSRCTILAVPGLEMDGITELVKRGMKACHSHRSRQELVEKLMEKRITSPRLILRAVQKYANDETTVDEAAEVALVSDVDTYAICRSVTKGDWEAVAKILSQSDNSIAIQAGVSGYLKAILLAENDFGQRTKVVADAIIDLSRVGDNMPATAAVLWKICKYFRKESR